MYYARPADHIVPSPKIPTGIPCPKCEKDDVHSYAVLSEGGWYHVVRCQSCLFQLEREPWRIHGPLEFLADDMGA